MEGLFERKLFGKWFVLFGHYIVYSVIQLRLSVENDRKREVLFRLATR